jgi:hypothetical protein
MSINITPLFRYCTNPSKKQAVFRKYEVCFELMQIVVYTVHEFSVNFIGNFTENFAKIVLVVSEKKNIDRQKANQCALNQFVLKKLSARLIKVFENIKYPKATS